MLNRLHPIRSRLVRDQSGFTLIELLIVMIVLGIVLAIAAPSYLSFKDKGRKTAAAANLRNVAEVLAAYANDNYAGAPTSSDPDWNGTDAARTGTNADSGFHNAWSGHTMQSLLQAKYNPGTPSFTIDPTGYTPSPNDSTAYCIYTNVGPWYAARLSSSTGTTVGKLLTLSTCTAS